MVNASTQDINRARSWSGGEQLNTERCAESGKASPIGVFDAGIGSYAIVEKLRKSYPQQDLIYLADRKQFPYGKKNYRQLLDATLSASQFLLSEGCSAVVLASNAPSIVVMQELKQQLPVPLLGVEPPLAEACLVSVNQQVIVLGVESMVSSEAFSRFLDRETVAGCSVSGINASSLVGLVEDFSFIHQPQKTQQLVSDFITAMLQAYPQTDVVTMSSTHLPWLKPYFTSAAPQIAFLDPADTLVSNIAPLVTTGRGVTRCIATESRQYPVHEFNIALASLNTGLVAELVSF